MSRDVKRKALHKMGSDRMKLWKTRLIENDICFTSVSFRVPWGGCVVDGSAWFSAVAFHGACIYPILSQQILEIQSPSTWNILATQGYSFMFEERSFQESLLMARWHTGLVSFLINFIPRSFILSIFRNASSCRYFQTRVCQPFRLVRYPTISHNEDLDTLPPWNFSFTTSKSYGFTLFFFEHHARYSILYWKLTFRHGAS